MPEHRDEPAHRRRGEVGRLPVLGLVAVVALGGILLGRHGPARPDAAVTAAPGSPVVAPASAVTSTWYCAGATDTRGGDAPGSVVIANTAGAPRRATVELVTSRGAARTVVVGLAPGGRASVPETVARGTPWIGAVVEIDGGGAGVDEEISGPLGTIATPCATAGSSSWYFASGQTLVNASEEITLLNPYPVTATVDLTFTTNQGIETPGALQAIVVPPETLVAVPVQGQLSRRSFIATTVTATSGRVVAWKTDLVTPPARGAVLLGTRAATAPLADPASPDTGVTVVLGTPAPARAWSWPEGISGPGITDDYELYDPGPKPAEVVVAVHLSQDSAAPLTLSVGAGQVTTIDMASESRIPTGVPYTVVVTSRNGVPIVAERAVTQSSPARPVGIGELFGATSAARGWLLGAGGVSSTLDEQVVVANPTGRVVEVDIDGLGTGTRQPLPGLAHVRIGPYGQLLVDLGRLRTSLAEPLEVIGSSPVVVGRVLLERRGRGIGLSLGIPLAG
jgi:hypothetical protein